MKEVDKFSIITINYNNSKGLRKTIESVINQAFRNFEYIIIDGGSNDASVKVIKDYESNITYWVSEKDRGVYNAQNKGIQKATGEYLIFLNSGDYFENDSVLKYLSTECGNRDIVFGNIRFKEESTDYVIEYPKILDFEFFLNQSLPHPSTAIKKSLFDKYGLYNEHFKICADWVFFLDMICKNSATYIHLNQVVSVFLTGGLSSDIRAVENEKSEYLKENYAAFYDDYVELMRIREKYNHLRNSRVIKIVSKVFTQYKGLLNN